jgi:hypothetical protein
LFYSAIGILESRDFGETIAARSTAPIVDRSIEDPYSITAPWVLVEQGRWRMWYVSVLRWGRTANGPQSFYRVKYAESDDGLNWRRTGAVPIDLTMTGETNIGRPCVLRGSAGYEAWFGYDRGEGYRIGYGRSADGLTFDRNVPDPPVVEPSTADFETDTVCHPAIVSYRDKRFMFYNGNNFGKDGVALAVEKTS